MLSAQAKRWFIWLLLGGVLIAAMTMLLWPRSTTVDLAVMSPGILVVTIDEEGETRVRNTFVLSAPVAGHIKRIDVEVGDTVIAGNTVLAEIEPIDPTLLDVRTMAQAEAAVHAAEAAQELAMANLAQAQAEVEFDEAELNRAQQLYDENIIPIRDLDAAQRNAKTSRAALNTVAAALGVSRYDLVSARAQLLTPTDSAALREG
jgi:HlyD family secretion protein